MEYRRTSPHDFRILECDEGFCIQDLTDGYIHDALSADPHVFRTRKEAEDWIEENAPTGLTTFPHRC